VDCVTGSSTGLLSSSTTCCTPWGRSVTTSCPTSPSTNPSKTRVPLFYMVLTEEMFKCFLRRIFDAFKMYLKQCASSTPSTHFKPSRHLPTPVPCSLFRHKIYQFFQTGTALIINTGNVCVHFNVSPCLFDSCTPLTNILYTVAMFLIS